jgi:adenine-specific DNA-methyltransferase
MLNRDDNNSHYKCILVEQGNYVYTVILPRIKKIAYSFDWKDGKPKNRIMNGLGVFIKYQRLEQYEESLENIAFTGPAEATQLAVGFKDYIPKYFLEFETRDSQTLVNTAAMLNPWSYELRVWDGFTYGNQQAVDLIETFNYLIGLHMHKNIVKLFNSPDGNLQRYQFVYGHTNAGKQVLIIWRDVTGWQEANYVADKALLTGELSAYAFDVLYINHQALLENYQATEDVFKTHMIFS